MVLVIGSVIVRSLTKKSQKNTSSGIKKWRRFSKKGVNYDLDRHLYRHTYWRIVSFSICGDCRNGHEEGVMKDCFEKSCWFIIGATFGVELCALLTILGWW